MKLSNIFKKAKAKTTNSIIETMDKNQLEKVIGGTEEVLIEETSRNINTTVMGPAKGK